MLKYMVLIFTELRIIRWKFKANKEMLYVNFDFRHGCWEDIFRWILTPLLDVRKFKRLMTVVVDDGMTL
jgi:hypothetical protein